MSGKHLLGINLNRCACGGEPIRRSQFVGHTTLYWLTCPGCGIHTGKADSEADAEFDWNEGNVLQDWELPISSCGQEVPGPAPASLQFTPPAPAA